MLDRRRSGPAVRSASRDAFLKTSEDGGEAGTPIGAACPIPTDRFGAACSTAGYDKSHQGTSPLRQMRRPSTRQPSDIMRCLERMLRRAGVPMVVTQGFNPRPKMTFALALGLGIEARREVVDLELSEPLGTVRAPGAALGGRAAGFRLGRRSASAIRRDRSEAQFGRVRIPGDRRATRSGPYLRWKPCSSPRPGH